MKKLVALFVILAAFLSFNTNSTFSQPQLKLHVTGGYNLPMPDLKGTYPDDINKDPIPYFMKSGFHAGVDGKYYLGKKRNVGITLSGGYNSFSSGDMTGVVFSNGNNSLDTGTVLSKINMITIGLGVEYNFLPKGKTQPFLGVEFNGNFFSGNTKYTPKNGNEFEATLKSASRFGIAIGGGLDFKLSKQVGAVVGVKYHMSNLIGKDSATSTGSGNANSTNEYTLYDKDTTVTKARNIGFIQLYAGVSFFFNEPKKVKK